MNTSLVPPLGHRHFRDVRDELGSERTLAELVSGRLIAVYWDRVQGKLRDIEADHWLSSRGDYTLRNCRPYSKYPSQDVLLVREEEPTSPPIAKMVKNKGGRPREYDWDAFYREVIRIANEPDGLPAKQAELEETMLAWCSREWDREPGESTVRTKVSAIYKALPDRSET